jgi:hypothetical protein
LALSYWIDYLGFITKGKLTAVLITPSLGVPNWSVIYIINTATSQCHGRRNPSVFRPDKSRKILIHYCPHPGGNPDSEVLQTLI